MLEVKIHVQGPSITYIQRAEYGGQYGQKNTMMRSV
jgi:hypothetical protein